MFIRPSCLSIDNGKQPSGFPNSIFSFFTCCFSAPISIHRRVFPSTKANGPSVSLIPFFSFFACWFSAPMFIHPSCLSLDDDKQPFGFPNPVFSPPAVFLCLYSFAVVSFPQQGRGLLDFLHYDTDPGPHSIEQSPGSYLGIGPAVPSANHMCPVERSSRGPSRQFDRNFLTS